MSLYDKYGGIKNISLLVINFYDQILENPQLSPYFSHLKNMDALADY